jgi:hypothetical protein
MSASHAFNAGWQDRLLDLPPAKTYETARSGVRVAYERGRHTAMLWLVEVQRQHGTIHNARGKLMSYAQARRGMSKELKALIREEQKFCSLKPFKSKIRI